MVKTSLAALVIALESVTVCAALIARSTVLSILTTPVPVSGVGVTTIGEVAVMLTAPPVAVSVPVVNDRPLPTVTLLNPPLPFP
jgi:hypothetical protein